MTTQLKWRLSKLPSVDELRELVKDKIITQEEAREILFNKETAEDRDKESLKEEIKFLREMVDNLSKNNTYKIQEVIRYIPQPILPNTIWWNKYSDTVNFCVSNGTTCSLSKISTF